MAQGLLANTDDKIRFFGALTIIVKLNNESSSLTEEDSEHLLQNLISWLVTSLNQGSGPMAIKKLCSALVTYFFHFSEPWHRCVRHLVCCLNQRQSIPLENLDQAPITAQILKSLDARGTQAALWFASTLVEDANKTDMNSPKYIPLHGRIIDNMPDIVALLTHGMDISADVTHKSQEESLKCLQSWILYAQKTSSEGLVGPLRSLVNSVIICLADDSVYAVAIELITDTLANYPAFFMEDHYRQFFSLFDSPWSQERYQRLVEGDDDFESVQFGLFMLALGDSKIDILMKSLDEKSQNYLSGLGGLLSAKGYPIVDDRIFVPALEFWASFAELMTDTAYSDDDRGSSSSWMPKAMEHMRAVVERCWRKIQFPPPSEFSTWDSTDRTAFGDARKDVADLLQTFYAMAGPQLVSMFADLTLKCLTDSSWAELEASAYCLSSLSDCLSDESNSCDDILLRVFSSPLFDLLRQSSTSIPVKLRQTSLLLIERYSDFFERHSQYLPAALNLLFTAVTDPLLANPSSRTVHTLCSSCRSRLISDVGTFLDQYQTFTGSHVLDSIVEERIVGGIASIIQAIQDEHHRLAAFEKLLSPMKAEAERALSLAAQPSMLDLNNPLILRGYDPSQHVEGADPAIEVALHLALRSLRCLGSAGRGIQVPTESVDLDNVPRYPQPGSTLERIQVEIISMLTRLQSTFSNSGELVEACCIVFRSGFCETDLGPFVFPPNIVAEFFLKQTFSTPRIGTIVHMACTFASSLRSGGIMEHIEAVMGQLLPWVFRLLQQLPQPDADVELAHNAIEFTGGVVYEKYVHILMAVQPTSLLEFFFLFTLNIMESKEPLAKAASSTFWANFLKLRPTDQSVSQAIRGAMDVLGPPLARALIQNVGGNCSRSEINSICEPLKHFVCQDVRSQGWLQAALIAPDFPSHRVNADEKAIFLKKITNLRGARATNQVVRDFWLACRGSSFAYVS